MRKLVAIVILICTFILAQSMFIHTDSVSSQNKSMPINEALVEKPVNKKAMAWADSLIKKMTAEEKIGQLFMLSAYSNRDSSHVNKILNSVKNYHIGGLIFFQGGPVRQAQLTNIYQQQSKIPLFIGMDAEWGLSMRIDSTIRYPKQMPLGAIQNDTLIQRIGEAIGRECKRMGVHINFGPVADINNNSANPVINVRSFGEDRKKVVQKSLMYYKGLQKSGVMACAKHFPGHGDTETDSHYGLPVLQHSYSRLDSLEFYPFKKLIEADIPSVMVAHMSIPTLDTAQNLSSVFSKNIVYDLLQQKLGFKGLVFTDALNMQGAKTRYAQGEIELQALLAGNDVLICSDSIEVAVATIKNALADGRLKTERLNQSVKKILVAKYQMGLHKKQKVKTEHLINDLNQNKDIVLAKMAAEKSLTLLKNNKNILPLKRLDTLSIAVISIGDSLNNTFIKSVERYAPVKKIALGKYYTGNILDSLKNSNFVITCVHYSAHFPARNYMVTETMQKTLQTIQENKKNVVVALGNAYHVPNLVNGNEEALLLGYENTENTQDLTGMVLFGGATCTGKLPVTISTTYKKGDGLSISNTVRFKYVLPEELGINSKSLARVDSIAINGINEGAYPGCVVLAAKNGKVFYQKAFGHHKFDKARSVQTTDIYDLASVTKISATVTSLMRLTDEKKFSLDDKLGKYLPEVLDSSVYANTQIRKMLAHEAGFVDWIPFFLKVYKNGKYDQKVFRTKPEPGFTTRIHDNLYILNTYEDSIFKTIRKTPLRGSFGYKYSDLGYYFLKRVVQKQTGKPLNEYAWQTFYKPLGLTTMGYLPRQRFSVDRIPPTEDDKTFRNILVHGDVHDQGAAMVGGVGGHAGLFANANDVAVLFQMLMNYGTYGGERYIKEATLKEWTKCQYCAGNRRGAGFDRPTMSEKGPTCECVSAASFGHTGFTGITAWADPESGIVYIFLSNRSHPVAENNKIINMGIRTRIQEVINDAASGAVPVRY